VDSNRKKGGKFVCEFMRGRRERGSDRERHTERERGRERDKRESIPRFITCISLNDMCVYKLG